MFSETFVPVERAAVGPPAHSRFFSISNGFPIFLLLWVQFKFTLILRGSNCWGDSLGTSHYSAVLCAVNILLLIGPGDTTTSKSFRDHSKR